MRLYSLQGAESVHHEDHGSFDVDPDTGAVEVPHELGEHLHATHIGGEKAWETEAERHVRLVSAELERRRDPAAMYDLLSGVNKQAEAPALPAAPVIILPVDTEVVTLVGAAGVAVSGTVEQDGTITLYDGDAIVGATISSSGEWSTILPLSDGPHVLSACLTVAGATSVWAAPVSITVVHQAEPTPEPTPEPAKKAPAKKATAPKAEQ